jgi:hypothetical protein
MINGHVDISTNSLYTSSRHPVDGKTYFNNLEQAKTELMPTSMRYVGLKFVVKDGDGIINQPKEYIFKGGVSDSHIVPYDPLPGVDGNNGKVLTVIGDTVSWEESKGGADCGEDLQASCRQDFEYTSFDIVTPLHKWTNAEVDSHNSNLISFGRLFFGVAGPTTNEATIIAFLNSNHIYLMEYGYESRIISEIGEKKKMNVLEYADRQPGAIDYSQAAFKDILEKIGQENNKKLYDGIYYVRPY